MFDSEATNMLSDSTDNAENRIKVTILGGELAA